MFAVFLLLVTTTLWSANATPRFERDVKPLLNRYCFQCHGEALKMGGLDIRTPSLMVRGGIKGPALEKGSAANSLLYRRIADKTMPMGEKKLSEEEMRLIKDWIDA
ncbi:MAG: c-type cytochrome domain-containing protein, partial [Bryobacteraceae bacterium]